MRVIDFKNASCRHCYKCVRYCDVKAISVKDEQAHIMEDHCIHCGHCLEVCPQNAKTFASDMETVKVFLGKGERVVISIAPSFLGIFDYDVPEQVVSALIKLGFSEVRETSEGAALVTAEYGKILNEGKMDNIITTCCPSVNDLIEKYYPKLVPYMAPAVSPMIAHGRLIKKLYGQDTKVVFLGPCVAKKAEALGDDRVEGAIDAILTFEEILKWWEEEDIEPKKCEPVSFGNESPRVNRLYPVSAGIIHSVSALEGKDDYYKTAVDGLQSCMQLFEELEKGKIHHGFFEVNVCEGGCIKGPASGKWDRTFVVSGMEVETRVKEKTAPDLSLVPEIDIHKIFSDRRLRKETVPEEKMTEILHQMGKYSPQDELNCGACGYSSCRDKAEAVYFEKAEIGMCMPFALSRMESISNVVMEATPNSIFLVDRNMRILDCNKEAETVLCVSRDEARERYIFEFVEEKDIAEVFESKESVIRKKIRLQSLKMTVLETIIYIENLDSVMLTYIDISREEERKEQGLKLKMETVEAAQHVIDKQMVIAQEIAGLLGETTAETKVTLSKLRDAMLKTEDL